MSEEIYRIDSDLPTTTKIDSLNDMILLLEGWYEMGKFNKNELDHLYDLLCGRKYLRNQGIGNLTTTYTSWSHILSETGYSIWKFTPTSYKYNSLNRLYINDKLLENKGEADSESASTFTKVFVFDGSTYTERTTEAGTEGGTQFDLLADTGDYLYLGLNTTFKGVKFEFHTQGRNNNLVVEYYNEASGDGFEPMTANINDLNDDTSNFESNGRITWSIPTDWTTHIVNSQNAYWIRISTSIAPVTTAKAYYIIPGNSVPALLALSSDEVQKENWIWCSYNNSIYVTIRNAGNASYEGDYYITSSSSVTNLRNFFVYNKPFTADYENRLYDEVVTITSNSGILETDSVILVNSTLGDIYLSLPTAVGNKGKRLIIKKIVSNNIVYLDPQSGEKIENLVQGSLAANGLSIEIISDGSNWWCIASYLI